MSLTRDYTLRYIVDTSQASPAFAAINQHFATMQASAAATATSINAIGVAFTNLTGAGTRTAQAVQQQLHGTQTAANQTAQAVQQITAQLNNLQTTAARVSQNLNVNLGSNHASFLGLNAELVTTYAAFQALQAGVQIITDMAQKTRDLRDHMKELADDTARYRDDLREIAYMKDKPGPDDQVMGEALGFGLKSAMTPDQASKFLKSFLDSNASGKQLGNIGKAGATPAEVEKAQEEISVAGARFGQRTGIDARTAGDLTGIMSKYGRVEGGEQASQKLGRVMYGLKQVGRGDINALSQGFVSSIAALVNEEGEGAVGDIEELAVLYGNMSTHHSPAAAGTYLKKGAHQLRNFSGPQAEGLERMGITPDMDLPTAVKKAREFIKADGRAPDLVLDDLRFRDRAGKQAVIELTRDTELFDKRREEQLKISGKDVQKADETFFTRNTSGLRMQAESKAAAQKHLSGKQHELVEIARLNAITRMKTEERFFGKDKIFADSVIDLTSMKALTGEAENVKERVNQTAIDNLVFAARNAGIPEEEIQSALVETSKAQMGTDEHGNHVLQPEYDKTHMLFNRLGPQIQARGFDPLGTKIPSVGMAVGEMAKPASAKAQRAAFRDPQVGAGVLGGILGMAGSRTVNGPKPFTGAPPGIVPGQELPGGIRVMSNDKAPGQGGTGGAGSEMGALLAELKAQTGLLRQQAMGAFGDHPDFGGGYTPRRV